MALLCIMLNYFSSFMVGKCDITFLFGEFFTENLSKTLVSYSLYLVDSSCIPYLIISYAYLLWVMGHPCSFACSCALSPFFVSRGKCGSDFFYFLHLPAEYFHTAPLNVKLCLHWKSLNLNCNIFSKQSFSCLALCKLFTYSVRCWHQGNQLYFYCAVTV